MSSTATAITASTSPGRAAAAGSASSPRGWRTELVFFAAAYAIYTVARWVFVGDLAEAREHARWIVELEHTTGVAIEQSVQHAFDSDVASWLLSNLYLTAQLLVVPITLIWLYRRAPDIYGELRNTVVTTWLISVPVFALFPVAPPRLADIGIADSVSQHTFDLAGRSTIFYNPLAAGRVSTLGFAVGRSVSKGTLRHAWVRLSAASNAG